MRKAFLALALACTLFLSGCLGPNNAQRSTLAWNATLTEMNWLNEVLFLFPLGIVHALAGFGDVLIFNTMNYWGTNAIEDPGEIVDSIRSNPKTPRKCIAEQESLIAIREKVRDHIKNTYEKQLNVPMDAPGPSLKCWMELTES